MKKLVQALTVICHAEIDNMALQFSTEYLPNLLQMSFPSIQFNPTRDITQFLSQRLFAGFYLDRRKTTISRSCDIEGKTKEIETTLLSTTLERVTIKFNTLRLV